MKKVILNKVKGIALGALVVAAVAGGIGAGQAAKANNSSVVDQEIQLAFGEGIDIKEGEEFDMVFYTEAEIDQLYKGLESKFKELTFSEQKEGLKSFLEYSMRVHEQEGNHGYADMCKTDLEKVNGATSSDELIKLVESDETLLNFLDVV